MSKETSQFTEELGQKICDLLCQGVTIEEIARRDDIPVSAWTIHSWKSEKDRPKDVPESFSQDIARARAIGYDVIASRLRDTARGNGESTSDVQRDKLIIDTDLKLLSKWTKKYSDKLDIESSGELTVKVVDLTGRE